VVKRAGEGGGPTIATIATRIVFVVGHSKKGLTKQWQTRVEGKRLSKGKKEVAVLAAAAAAWGITEFL